MRTARQKIRDEQDARACWAAAQAAGLDAGAWGRAHGVDGRSLHTWRMNLATRPTLRFVSNPPDTATRPTLRFVSNPPDTGEERPDPR